MTTFIKTATDSVTSLVNSLVGGTARTLPFTEEALTQVIATLETVGLTEKYGFPHHAQDAKAYQFGGLEWSERGYGSRFYLHLGPNGRVNEIKVINLHSSRVISEEKLVEVNAKLAQILEESNQ